MMRPYNNNSMDKSVFVIGLVLLMSGLWGSFLMPSVKGQEINENTDWIGLVGEYDMLANPQYSNETSWKSDQYTILNGFMRDG